MLKSLHLKNVQSHKDTYLEFSPGVNIIIGPSDSGKTAILRALRWLIWNRPQGDVIRRRQGGETSVEVVLDDEIVVKRIKDNKQDQYVLNDYVFKAFKSEVPEEVLKALNIDVINLQRQLDAPFLLSETPGVVAQHFNRVANLDVIDVSLQRINSEIRELSQNLKFYEQEKTKLTSELEQYDYVDKLSMEVEVLEELGKANTDLRSKLGNLSRIIHTISHNEEEIEKMSYVVEIEGLLNNVLDRISEHEAMKERLERLKGILAKIESTNEQMKYERTLVSMEGSLSAIISDIQKVEELHEHLMEFEEKIAEIENVESEIERYEMMVKEKMELFEREMPDVCPLCGSIVKKDEKWNVKQ